MTYKYKSIFAKHKAFTLIELLIVIAIIGILFIVLVSKVDFATDKAKATGVQTDFRSFQMAFDTVAKEHAGFNMFGWDTGDANQDGIRNSYDKGDTNQNGIQDGIEVFTGHKVYAETFTGVYSLKKNGTGDYDRDALSRLETAINSNLDPKLHITIKDDGEIVMANGAKDPWNTEYHGYYITNAEVDNKDRGALIMYSNGTNQEFGSEHSITNGIVSINVPGNNKLGADDYSLAVTYTYVNGYGEVQNITTGFSNNQSFLSKNPTIDENIMNTQQYFIIFGSEQRISGASDATFSSNADFNKFLYVMVDNNIVNEQYYSVVSGSTVVTLKEEYLQTLSIGQHTLSIHSNDGFAQCYFYIEQQLIGYAIFNDGVKLNWEELQLDTNGIQYGYDNTKITNETLNMAFYNCTSLQHIVIPDGITSLGANEFNGCRNLQSLKLPRTVTSIGSWAFLACSLKDVYIEDLYTFCNINFGNIIANPLYPATNLYVNDELVTNLIIPNGVTYIYDCLFKGTSIESVVIPEGVVSIGYDAFRECKNLKDVTIPKSVMSIGTYAFSYSDKLTNVYISDIAAWCNIQFSMSGTNYGSNPLFEAENLYVNGELITELVIPDNVSSIPDYAFYGQDSIKTVIVSDNVTSIGVKSFAYCSNLESIQLPMFLETIENSAFYWDQKLQNIILPNTVKTIGDSAFSGCGIESIVIPEGIAKIGISTFAYCSRLTNVVIPNTVTVIDNYAFFFCSKVLTFNLPNSITYIGNNAFAYCYQMPTFTIPENITYIGHSAFAECDALRNVYFNGNVDQWNNIVKENISNKNTPFSEVICLDGIVTLN